MILGEYSRFFNKWKFFLFDEGFVKVKSVWKLIDYDLS